MSGIVSFNERLREYYTRIGDTKSLKDLEISRAFRAEVKQERRAAASFEQVNKVSIPVFKNLDTSLNGKN
ncbi:MAG: hypothetical protein WCF65_04275 [Parachlamydiaceae bacterium]